METFIPKSKWLYVITYENEKYKIGVASDIKKRLAGFRTYYWKEPIVVFSVEINHPYGLEKELHEHFAEKRISGEWFLLTGDDIQIISGICENHLRERLENLSKQMVYDKPMDWNDTIDGT